MPDKKRTVQVDFMTRVEGEGGLFLKLRGPEVEEMQLRIFEPPRFFEALLRGRQFTEAPDITARICGICPVAYQMSAVAAMEMACGVAMPAHLRTLRRLLYCGEWISSHVLHISMLHAPDFLGYPDAVAMARDHRPLVEDALTLKRAGNHLMSVLGGREIHPVNVRVGGFYRLLTRDEATGLLGELEAAVPLAERLLERVAGLPFPEWELDYEFVALTHPEEYPITEGRIASSRGWDLAVPDFDQRFEEFQVPQSHALHARIKGGGPYLVGPLARYALNFERLPADLRQAAREAGLGPVVRNPYRSIVVRALEVLLALGEAIRILKNYEPGAEPAVPVPPRAGVGHGATEAPRGLLYHRYRLEPDGSIADACIVPPTSQNQGVMELDLRGQVAANVRLPDAELGQACERAVRNYDPCISCATHFLKLTIDRGEEP